MTTNTTPRDSRILADKFRRAVAEADPAARMRAQKALLAEERERIRAAHLAGAAPRTTAAELSLLVDIFLRSHLEARRNATRAASKLALVAVGGYGRREMCPQSDVDLLILTPSKPGPEILAEAEAILYPLWDLGFHVGHSVRSVGDAKTATGRDVETHTAFLQERLIAGDFELYQQFVEAIARQPSSTQQKELVRQKVAERSRRLNEQGGLAQMLEPNIKEGRGCLRDVHTLVWMAGFTHGARQLDDLVRAGILSPEELEDVRVAYDFLLRARISLHYANGRKSDRLGFEEQPQVAAILGYRDEEGRPAVELFQKDFYRQVRVVDSVTTEFLERFGMERPRFRRRQPSRDPRFRQFDGELEMPFDGPNPFLGDIGLILDLFRVAQSEGIPVAPHTRWYLRQAIALMKPDEIDRATALPKLLEIARRSDDEARVLRELHRMGVVNLVVPDFALIDCHSQHDIYHVYTTDEHTLTVLSRLARLPASKDPVLAQLCAELAKIDDLDVLYVAALYHDIGKGLGPNHSETGSKLVREYCLACGMSEARAVQAADLVLHHLHMNYVAQRRDLEDEKTVRDFLARIPDEHLLRKLYVLTYADVSSVHPDAWSAWKAQLLEQLYRKALEELSGSAGFDADSETHRQALAQAVPRHSLAEVEAHLAGLPRRYASSFSPQQVAEHLDLIGDCASTRRVAVGVSDLGIHFDVVVVSPDSPGLLARISAGLATLHLSVASAQVYTRRDGVVIDLFSVMPLGDRRGIEAGDLARKAAGAIERLRSMPLDEVRREVDDYIEKWKASFTRIMNPGVSVEFHDEASDHFTVLDITCPDRLGLMFLLAAYFSGNQWVIHAARISTEADRAHDSFYLARTDGARISGDEVRETARIQLSEMLSTT